MIQDGLLIEVSYVLRGVHPKYRNDKDTTRSAEHFIAEFKRMAPNHSKDVAASIRTHIHDAARVSGMSVEKCIWVAALLEA